VPATPYATLPPPPPALPIWARVLYYLAESVAIGIGFKQYEWGLEMKGTETGSLDTNPDEWRRVRLRWDDTMSNDPADSQVMTFDVVNYTNGALDSSWTDADHQAVDAAFRNFVFAGIAHTPGRLTCKDISQYRMAFNGYSNEKPFAPSGPPVWSSNPAATGTGNGQTAPQGCSTITELTPLRKHWGRSYVPSLSTEAYDVAGRITNATIVALAASYNDLVTALHASDFFTVVPTTQSEKAPLRALQQVTGCKVDDVPDVIRRRRPKSVKASVTHDVDTPLGGQIVLE
jgi:hypothetical protein